MTSLLDTAPTALFCAVDDFCGDFLPQLASTRLPVPGKRTRTRSLCESEIMTILIAFHQSHYRDFKAFYLGYVCVHWKAAFPGLVSYSRFVEFIPSVLIPLFAYLRSLFGQCTGVTFADSTPLSVCDNHRIKQHKVVAHTAKRGKTSTGWFFGFKLHLLTNDRGELLNATLTPGNVDDRKPLPSLLGSVFGRLFADKGYISEKLTALLEKQGVTLVTKRRKNMKPRNLSLSDRLLLRKRAIVETVIDQLKNISQVEHTRHRAATGFLWNVVGALIAYCHQPTKPSLKFAPPETLLLS